MPIDPMTLEDYANYCESKPHVTASFPFNDHVLVYKVCNKIFTLADINPFVRINLKCDPAQAVLRRAQYTSLLPGYHMHKKHWNTIVLNEEIPDALVYRWIDESYTLIKNKLPKNLLGISSPSS